MLYAMNLLLLLLIKCGLWRQQLPLHGMVHVFDVLWFFSGFAAAYRKVRVLGGNKENLLHRIPRKKISSLRCLIL